MNYLIANDQSNSEKGIPIFEGSYTVASGETSDPILLSDGEGPGSYWQIALIPGGNNGRFELTLSPRATVKSGGGNWIPWDAGNVSTSTSDSLTPVQAVRIVSVSGEITGEVMVI